MKYQLIVLMLTTAIFASCKKEVQPAPLPKAKTKTELLTDHAWKQSGWTVEPAMNINGTLYTNLFPLMADCQKDDFIRYEANGNFTIDAGAVKCDTNEPQTQSLTWNFNSDETIIHMGSGPPSTVLTLTENELVISGKSIIDGKEYTFTNTYSTY